MGIELDLFVADESIESPWFSRSFLNEIIFENYIQFDDFLTGDEYDIIKPNAEGEVILGEKRKATFFEKAKLPFVIHKAMKGKITVEEINALRDKLVHRSERIEDREREPLPLKCVLKKVEEHLICNSDTLPLVHSLFEDEALENEVFDLEVGGIMVNVDGDLFYKENYAEIRNKILLKGYLEDYGKVHSFVEVKPEVEIEGTRYFTKTLTKAEQFKEEFEKCYTFLNEASKHNKKVLWEFE